LPEPQDELAPGRSNYPRHEYLASQPGPKQADLRRLHAHILAEFPGCRLWFADGTNADGKVVANPNIGYGACTMPRTYGGSIGKASVTGYCIKFKHLAAINVHVLQAAIQYGMSVHQAR